MSIRHWPEAERPREKLLKRGAQALGDAELLALFLGFAVVVALFFFVKSLFVGRGHAHAH